MFFRNMNHMMEGKEGLEKSLFQLALISYHGDMRPAFPLHFPWLEKTVSDNYFMSGHKSAEHSSIWFTVRDNTWRLPRTFFRLQVEVLCKG